MKTNKFSLKRLAAKTIGTITATTIVLTLASFKNDTEKTLSVGDKAPLFALKNIDGKTISLAESEKGAIVVFTCNHCPFAKKYEDRINALNKKYEKQGYPVIAINPNDVTVAPEDSYEKMQERAKQKGFTFPYLHDETQLTAREYGATKTPHVFVLQKSGTDFWVKYIGAIDDNTDNASAAKEKYVENAVNALLAGKEVAVTTTKAIGCTIKWKK